MGLAAKKRMHVTVVRVTQDHAATLTSVKGNCRSRKQLFEYLNNFYGILVKSDILDVME